MEVYGDLKDGYIEFTLWHERLSDLVVYMRPLNYPWQILWKVWNTSEAVNATVTIKRDLFGTDGNVEDIEALIPHEYFYAWKDWEIIVYDMEKGCEGKLESVKLEFGVATRVVSGDTDNDGLSDAYESEKIPVIAMDSVNPGTTMYSQPFSLPHYTHNCEVAVGYASYSPPNPPQDWPKATVKLQRQVPNTGTYLTVDTISLRAKDIDTVGELRGEFKSVQGYMPDGIRYVYRLEVNCNEWMKLDWLTMSITWWGEIDLTQNQKEFDVKFNIVVDGRYDMVFMVLGCNDTAVAASFEDERISVIVTPTKSIQRNKSLLEGEHRIHVVVLKGWYGGSSILMDKVQFDPRNPDIDRDMLLDGIEEWPMQLGETFENTKFVCFEGVPVGIYTLTVYVEYGGPFSVEVDGVLAILRSVREGGKEGRYGSGTYFLYVPGAHNVGHTVKIVFGWPYKNRGTVTLEDVVTSPFSYDTDEDYLTDYEEIFIYYTNPTNTNTDSDGFGDCCECIGFVTDPWSYTADSDGDGMPDEYEKYAKLQGSWQDPRRDDTRIAILGAGSLTDTNYAEFWNELIFLYDVLVWVYNYRPADIYVCYPLGKPPSSQTMNDFDLRRIYDMTRNVTSFVDPKHEGIIDLDFKSTTLATLYNFVATKQPSFVFSAYFCHGAEDKLGAETYIMYNEYGKCLKMLPQTTKQAILIHACKSGTFGENVIEDLSSSEILSNIGIFITTCTGNEYSFAFGDRCSIQNARKWWTDRIEEYNLHDLSDETVWPYFDWEEMFKKFYWKYADRDCEGWEIEFLFYFNSYLRKYHPNWGYFQQDYISFPENLMMLRFSLQNAFSYALQEASFAHEERYGYFTVSTGEQWVWCKEHPQTILNNFQVYL